MSHALQMDRNAKQWVKNVLNQNDNAKLLFEEVKATDLSIVQKVSLDNCNFYFKNSGIASDFEGRLSYYLNNRIPDNTIEIVDVHKTKPWFLMQELKGSTLRSITDRNVWKKTIQSYAEFQIELIHHVPNMVDLGVPNRRISVLKQEITNFLMEMCQTGLTEDETNAIMKLKPELLSMCDRMEGLIPSTIEHGDLHSANIQIKGDQPIFFDWGDASISHPFFSTRIFWHALDSLIVSEREWLKIVDEFKPHYLEPWTTYAPMHELEELLLISDQLSCVYRALGWHLYINPKRKNIEESRQKPAQWLQLLLEHRELARS